MYGRTRVITAVSLAVLAAIGAVPGASSGAPGASATCGNRPGLPTCLAGLVGASLSPRCTTQSPPPAEPGASASETTVRLAELIENVPCPTTGRVLYGAGDDHHGSLGVLDPLPSPTGGYIGVYHNSIDRHGWRFEICLARSDDLLHWHRIAVLDVDNASMPTLLAVGRRQGYLLAYEHGGPPHGQHLVRVRYYRSLAALEANRYAAQRDLPRLLSKLNEGTPSFFHVSWHGSPASSVIELGFHYEIGDPSEPGPDREAVGILRGFRSFAAVRDRPIDELIDEQGLFGSHGDRRQFSFAGRLWRVYEGQLRHTAQLNTWRVVLYDIARKRMFPLTIRTMASRGGACVGNPVVHIEPAPGGRGKVIVVTMFAFSPEGKPGRPGELIYYQPL